MCDEDRDMIVNMRIPKLEQDNESAREKEREAIIKWFIDNPPGEWTDKEIAEIIRKRGKK